MITRALALVVVLLLSGQAFASGARVMVCRYTGKVMTDCPCPPHAEEAQLQKQSCCDIVQSEPFAPTAVLREAASVPQQWEVGLAPEALRFEQVVVEKAQRTLPPSQAPPDDSDRYLRLRHLLN